jgi:hypothetical protein
VAVQRERHVTVIATLRTPRNALAGPAGSVGTLFDLFTQNSYQIRGLCTMPLEAHGLSSFVSVFPEVVLHIRNIGKVPAFWYKCQCKSKEVLTFSFGVMKPTRQIRKISPKLHIGRAVLELA